MFSKTNVCREPSSTSDKRNKRQEFPLCQSVCFSSADRQSYFTPTHTYWQTTNQLTFQPVNTSCFTPIIRHQKVWRNIPIAQYNLNGFARKCFQSFYIQCVTRRFQQFLCENGFKVNSTPAVFPPSITCTSDILQTITKISKLLKKSLEVRRLAFHLLSWIWNEKLCVRVVPLEGATALTLQAQSEHVTVTSSTDHQHHVTLKMILLKIRQNNWETPNKQHYTSRFYDRLYRFY